MSDVIWLAPRTPEEAADNVQAAHNAECGYDPCCCIERMRAALTGQPDPDDAGYAWPIMEYGCAEAPQYGCMTEDEAFRASLLNMMAGATIEGRPSMLPGSVYFVGLSERVRGDT